MSGPAKSNGRAGASDDGAGVLANLPRARPQRATARRAAARTEGATAPSHNGASADAPARRRPAAKAAVKPAESGAAAGTKTKTTAKAKAKPKSKPKAAPRRPAAPREEVPRQGFECIEERATGAVPPPGGPEFVGTAAEIVGELAKAGIAGGERLLRDVLSRLGR